MHKALVVTAGALVLAACSSNGTGSQSPGQLQSAIIVVATRSAIMTAEITDWNAQRERVEQFYPSICVDTDADDNGVPDTMDLDRSADDTGEVGELEDRCQPCNRGPGESGDFRLQIEGTQAELDRGRVFQVAADGTLTVPSPDGPITILVRPGTRIDDGQPTPGADVRVEGTVSSAGPRTIDATRVKTLCPGPKPVDDGDVPPGSTPAPTNPPPPTCKPRDFLCSVNADCCEGLVCNLTASGEHTCGPIP